MNLFKNSIVSVSLLFTSLYSSSINDASNNLACKEFDISGYYSKYNDDDNYWAYIPSSNAYLFVLKAGTLYGDEQFHSILSGFETSPVVSEDGKNVTFGLSNGVKEQAEELSNSTHDINGYYLKYDDENNYWAYIPSTNAYLFALKAGTLYGDDEFISILSQFDTAPVLSEDGKSITFGALKGQTCNAETNTTIEEPPSTPDLNSTDTTNNPIGLPPQVPSV